MQRTVRTSAKAIVIRDGRLLTVAISDGSETWYILPGGGQNAGEFLPAAVSREVLEETGVRAEAKELAFVIEGAHGESFHRVDLVFLCEDQGNSADAPLTADHGQTGVAWLDIATLNVAPLYPSRLRRPIMNLHQGKPGRIYLGNEEIGDPEETS